MKIFYLIITVFVITACAVGSDYSRPKTATYNDNNFINASLVETSANASINQWWTRINDPLLQDYIDQLLMNNLDIEQAKERVTQARENANISRSDFFPSVSADANAARSFSNPNSNGVNERLYASSYSADLNASWQIDLFGKIRRSNESVFSTFKATTYDYQALVHTLIADVLSQRIAIATLAAQRDLAQQTAENRQKIYTIVKRRYDLGTNSTTATDVLLAEQNASSTTADINAINRQLADSIYTLDVLLGQPPGTTNPLDGDFPLMPPPLDIPLCLPGNLIDRRPDIRASELRLKAANANIGVAVADLYPALNLTGSIGFSSNQRTNLFSVDQLAGSILSAITTRIFEGGKLRSTIRLRESQAREQSAAYAQTILNAFKDVESALKAESEITQELFEVTKSVNALQKAVSLSEERYIRGIFTLQNLLDITQQKYVAEQRQVSLRQDLWNARVALYLALGGDWFDATNTLPQQCGAQDIKDK